MLVFTTPFFTYLNPWFIYQNNEGQQSSFTLFTNSVYTLQTFKHWNITNYMLFRAESAKTYSPLQCILCLLRLDVLFSSRGVHWNSSKIEDTDGDLDTLRSWVTCPTFVGEFGIVGKPSLLAAAIVNVVENNNITCQARQLDIIHSGLPFSRSTNYLTLRHLNYSIYRV